MLDGLPLPVAMANIAATEGKASQSGRIRFSSRAGRLVESEASPATSRERTMPGSVIVSAAPPPIGRQAGGLAGFSAMELGGFAIKAALERAGISGDAVDYVIMGQVLQAGQGQITARQAAVKGGIPMSVPAMTLNKVCLPRINAL